jgi:hypothetical protein
MRPLAVRVRNTRTYHLDEMDDSFLYTGPVPCSILVHRTRPLFHFGTPDPSPVPSLVYIGTAFCDNQLVFFQF